MTPYLACARGGASLASLGDLAEAVIEHDQVVVPAPQLVAQS